jgi:hypothetical protein
MTSIPVAAMKQLPAATPHPAVKTSPKVYSGWAGGSIRTKMNGSVWYAMFCWQVFSIAVGFATRLPNKSAPEATTIQPGAWDSSQCDPTLDPRFVA